jgi:hypothetical protein
MAPVLKEAAITPTAAQAAAIAKALFDAEQYRRDSAVAWCADCAAVQRGACPDHVAFIAPADAYRDLAGWLATATKAAGRDVRASRTGLGTTPATTREEPSK